MDPHSAHAARLRRVDLPGEAHGADVGPEGIVIGRSSSTDLVPTGENVGMVSQRHARLFWDDGELRVEDLGSTNGTFVDGDKVSEAGLKMGSVVTLGRTGPQYRVEPADQDDPPTAAEEDLPTRLEPAATPKASNTTVSDDALLVNAVKQAREARSAGAEGHTVFFMREALDQALARSQSKASKRLAIVAGVLLAVLAVAFWRIYSLNQRQTNIDLEIAQIEEQLQQGGQSEAEVEALIDRLEEYQRQAEDLHRDVLYQFSSEGRERIFLENQIEAVIADFGGREFEIPAEFVAQVASMVEQYETRDRAILERVLGPARADMERMRAVLEQHKLPPDLAYITVVESAFRPSAGSSRGARGYWQFRPSTARHYGLAVDEQTDERTDPAKSTTAAARYIRDLILDFGAGTSVMLALAAYNVGPGRVRAAVRKVEDPIAQRNFWHLYRIGALPGETRQYVPKVFGAIIIARNAERYGFAVEPGS